MFVNWRAVLAVIFVMKTTESIVVESVDMVSLESSLPLEETVLSEVVDGIFLKSILGSDWNLTLNGVWEQFLMDYKRDYSDPVEHGKRFEIFRSNFIRITKHNILFSQGKVSYTMGINRFTDRTKEEYKQLLALKYNENDADEGSKFIPANAAPPDEIDWRKRGAVTPIKDQGQCGSCWAFSATGSIEGQHFLATKKLVSVSEQQLVDCSRKYGNEGCEGGLMTNAFVYLKHAPGIETEKKYPYISGKSGRSGRCRFDRRFAVVNVTGYMKIQKGSEKDLKQAVGLHGPVSIGIDAGEPSFMSYKSGIYSDPNCSSDFLNHGVLVVGYGEENNTPYWLVKNSWGPDWGDSGYIKMLRDHNNLCGVASLASYPLM